MVGHVAAQHPPNVPPPTAAKFPVEFPQLREFKRRVRRRLDPQPTSPATIEFSAYLRTKAQISGGLGPQAEPEKADIGPNHRPLRPFSPSADLPLPLVLRGKNTQAPFLG